MKEVNKECGAEVDLMTTPGGRRDRRNCKQSKGHKGDHAFYISVFCMDTEKTVLAKVSWKQEAS